jgi:ELWxxDGT repeat protein
MSPRNQRKAGLPASNSFRDGRTKKASRGRAWASFVPRVERLEDRCLLSITTGQEDLTDKAAIVGVELPSTSNVISLRYDLPAASMQSTEESVNGKVVSQVVMAGTSESFYVGQPVVPVVAVEIVVPYGYSLGTVEVVAGDRVALSGSFLIELAEAPVLLDSSLSTTAEEATDVAFETGGTLPDGVFEIVNTQWDRGVEILRVNLYPVDYSVDSGEVAYYTTLTLNVNLVAEDPASAESSQIVSYRAEDIESLASEVANPEALATYAQASTTNEHTTTGICDPTGSYQYVAITSRAFINATTDYTINDLIASKQALGMTAVVVALEDIYANYTGVDQAEQIRNFIIDAYNNWETDYVLLGGDSAVLPYRSMWVDIGSSYTADEKSIPSDLYYGCLDGTFNYDGDSYWGETNDGVGGGDVDFTAEVYVGRAAAETAAEMANWVYKAIAYEATASADYRRQAMMVGEYLGFGGVSDYATGSMEEIRLGSSANGYTTAGFASEARFTTSTLYDSSTYTWSASDLVSLFNSGQYGIYNHLGHANTSYVMKLSNSTVDTLTNTNYFFIYSQGCYPGNFPLDANAEHFTTSTRYGAAAVIFNSRYGWGRGNSTDGPSQRPDREFWDALFSEGINQLGVMNADSHEDVLWGISDSIIRWVVFETNLFGDPAAHIVSLNMAVVGSSPTDGAVVSTPPTDFSVTFSEPYLASSIDATDLQVNGISASSFVLTDANTVTFHFDVSPVTAQGVQTMSMAAGAVTRESDSSTSSAWSATFRYDAVASQVVSTEPADASIVTLPLTTLRLNFNEAIDPTTAGIDDLTLSQGSVIAATCIDSDTIEYTLSGITREATLTVTMAAGALTDLYGNSSAAYSGTLVLDYSTTAFPASLTAVEPLGSLTYQSSTSAWINSTTDTDSFTIDLDAGQTLTVLIVPATELIPIVTVVGPGGTLGTATATAAGAEAFLQTLAVSTAGTYTITVSSSGSTIGAYRLEILLNAALEAEAHDGNTNSTSDTAQDLNSAMIAVGDAQRAAVIGKISHWGPTEDFESGTLGSGWSTYSSQTSGRIQVTGTYGTASGSYALIMDKTTTSTYNLNEAIWTVNLAGLTTPILTFSVATWNEELNSLSGDFTGHANGDGVAISADGVTWHSVWSIVSQTYGEWKTYTIDLAATAATHGITLGNGFQIKFQQYGVLPLTSDGMGYDEIVISAPSCDWYRFDLEAGHSMSLGASVTGTATINLYDPTGLLVATAAPAANLASAIRTFVATTTGAYYVQVASMEADYHLLVVRDGDFDTENNSSLTTAQDLAGVDTVIGFVEVASSMGSTATTTAATTTATTTAGSTSSSSESSTSESGSTSSQTASTPDGENEGYVAGRLIIGFAEGNSETAMTTAITALGGTVVEWFSFIHAALVELNDHNLNVLAAAEAWAADPTILYAEPDYIVYADEIPNDASFSSLWGMNNTGQTGGTADADIDAPEAWEYTTGSSDIVIASIDTGVDYTHPDLAANMWVNPGEVAGNGIDDDHNGYIDDIYGIDACNDDSDPMDDNSHGTHTSGTMAAVGDNGIGVAGVNWTAKIMALKFLGADGSGDNSDAITCLEYLTMMKTTYGVNVVVSNNSWGGGSFSQALMDAIKASNDAGVVFVASAGNSGTNNDISPSYPASYDLPGIIAVASTDDDDGKASSSCYGATSVDLGAPGVSVYSTIPGGYGTKSGTSMASPHVAGAVALLKAFNSEATVAQLKAAILNGVDPVASLSGITVTGGRLNLARSLELIGDNGDYYLVSVKAGDNLVITTSTPADGQNEFDNDLDPRVELYDSSGNLVAQDDNSATDHHNARLTYTAPTSGQYTVRVVSASGSGEYVLSVAGATGSQLSPFVVTGSDIADGEAFASQPITVSLDFSDQIYLPSVQASDLMIDGTLAATAVEVIDGDTLMFTLPTALSEGYHTISIAAGAVEDLQYTSVDLFSFQIRLDYTAPRVITSSVAENEAVAAGSLTYSVQFDEPLLASGLDASDVSLVGLLTGSHSPASLAYDSVSNTLTLVFASLADDSYTLTLYSGDGKFEDLVGNDLDGSPSSPLPSGDGAMGGNFVLHFYVDQATAAFPVPLVAQIPVGSMIYSGESDAVLCSNTDTDSFSITLEAGQTLAVIVTPAASFAPTVAVYGPDASLLGSGLASAGQSVVVQNLAVATAGTYSITVGASGGTVGAFTVHVLLNATIENESQEGTDNDTLATAQNIDNSLIDVGSAVQRGAVVGTSDKSESIVDNESESNNTLATANNASTNFLAYSGNIYQLGITGTISSSTDADWYNIGALSKGDVITISMSGSPSSRGTLSNPYVYLYRYNSGTATLVISNNDYGPGADSLIYNYTISTADTYYVLADASGTVTGTYALGLHLAKSGTAPGTGGTLTSETEANDSMATANDASSSWRQFQYLSDTAATITSGDVDYFAYQFTAGDLVTVKIDSTSTLDARVWFCDSTGTVLALDDGTSSGPGYDSPLFSVLIATTGTYYLHVAASSGTGAYNADVYLSTTTAPPVPTPVYDYYSFSVTTGETITLAVQGETAGLVQLELLDAAGTVLATGTAASAPDAVIHNYAPASAGLYYARVVSALETPYGLVLLHNADFDTESNNTVAQAQDVSAVGNLQGSLGFGTTLIEGFEDGNIAEYVEYGGATGASVVTSVAHDGIYGLADDTNEGWLVRNDSAVHVEQGDTMSVWIRLGAITGGASSDGRAYFGFGASSAGTLSVVLAPNSNAFVIQDNTGFDYTTLATVAYTYSANTWYHVVVAWGTDGGIDASLFASDGNTLLSTVSATSDAITGGGIAFRAFGTTHYFDSVAKGTIDAGDYCTFTATAGNPIYLATATHGDVDGEFSNSLDTRLELYDSSGTLVAANDNGRNDGRNAELMYIAAKTGSYTVRVSARSTVSGEYLLTRIGAGLIISGISTDVAEGGTGDTCTVALSYAPTSTVTLQLNGGSQLTAVDQANPGNSFLTFTTENWNTPQTILISAVNDELREGIHSGTLSFTTVSTDVQYSSLSVTSLSVSIHDNDETAPTAADDTYSASTGSTFEVAAAEGVLANDSDDDGDSLSAVLVSGTTYGVLQLLSDGSFTYTPSSGFAGTDTFTYNAYDTVCESVVSATVTIHVEPPYLLKDINEVPAASSPQNLTNVNGVLFFTATDAEHGRELWKSDGTLEGTVLVKDIYSGSTSSSPAQLVNFGGVLYFQAYSSNYGTELWRSDGTEAGTYMVADIFSGSSYSSPANLTVVGDKLFFSAASSGYGTELWCTDGTAAGTCLVKDVNSGSLSSSPGNLRNVNGLLLFTANNGTNGTELWRSDGTEAGTVLVMDVYSGSTSSSLSNLTVVGDSLFFIANDGTNGIELWKSNGYDTGTALVKDIWSGSNSSSPAYLTAVGDKLFFSASDGTNGTELWTSDGTADGTTMVANIYSGSSSSSPTYLTNVGGILYFRATTSGYGSELWRSDGTSAGTYMVKDVYAGSSSSSPASLTAVGNWLYFIANDGTHGTELWRSDGTKAGTYLVQDIYAGSTSSSPANLTNVNGTLMFAATNTAGNTELWRSDDSAVGTAMVADIYSTDNGSSPAHLTTLGSKTLFTASDGTSGTELWITDGTADGTMRLMDIYAGSGSSSPSNLLNINGTVFFSAYDSTHATELWRTDGTAAGTWMLKDINSGSGSSSPYGFCNAAGILFFWANDGTNGTELWRSDGTSAGTYLVKDLNSGSGSSSPSTWGASYLVSAGSLVSFVLNDATYGAELWRSDGTAAGTYMVKDIYSGSTSSSPRFPAVLNGVLYFRANDATSGPELWRSDGTAAGTYMVKDIYSGSNGSYPSYLTCAGGILYFQACTSTTGYELWRSDGTADGTYLIKDIYSGSSSSSPYNLTDVNGTLYFQATTSTTGYELWRSDGTAAGTYLVKDIYSGSSSSSPSSIVDVNGTACFLANDGVHGQEIWVSDGTTAGTRLLADMDGESAGFVPASLTALGNQLVFTADDGSIGREVWAIRVANTAPTASVSLSSHSPHTNDTLTATVTPSDEDNDTITLTYVWKVNNVEVRRVSNTTATTDSLDLSTAGYGGVGDLITVEVTPNDGQADGTTVTDTATVAATLTVSGIYARGSGWDAGYLAMLAANNLGTTAGGFRLVDGAKQVANAGSLTWSNINQISVTFSENVTLNQASLRLLNSAGVDVSFAATNAFSYNSTTHTATWTLASSLGWNKYLIVLDATTIAGADGSALDGEWTKSSSTFAVGSGDGTPGGNCYFQFNVLLGDVTLNGQTNAGDAGKVSVLGMLVPTATNYRCDVTGNNRINAGDVGYICTRGMLSLASVPDPTIPKTTTLALQAAEQPGTTSATTSFVVSSQLTPLVAEAIERWSQAGLTAAQRATLESVQFEIADFGDCSVLAVSDSGLIRLDDNAAGSGWFVDSTPSDDAEFTLVVSDSQLQATSGSLAAGREDLLTVIMHELGHQLGLADEAQDSGHLMASSLQTGTRRLPPILPSQVSTAAVPSSTPAEPTTTAASTLPPVPPSTKQPEEPVLQTTAQTLQSSPEQKEDTSSPALQTPRASTWARAVDTIVADWALPSKPEATFHPLQSSGIEELLKPVQSVGKTHESAANLLAVTPQANCSRLSNDDLLARLGRGEGICDITGWGSTLAADEWLGDDANSPDRPFGRRWRLGS